MTEKLNKPAGRSDHNKKIQRSEEDRTLKMLQGQEQRGRGRGGRKWRDEDGEEPAGEGCKGGSERPVEGDALVEL